MKTFILDTNVLIHDPEALFTFEGSKVVIPLTVVEELDGFKKSNDSRGRSARQVSRYLDELRQHGKITEGVPLEHGGSLTVEARARAPLPLGFEHHNKDNRMLETALGVVEQGETVVFITKDINLRIKAEAIGLTAEDYEKEKVSPDKLYVGWRDLSLASDLIDKFFKSKKLEPPVDIGCRTRWRSCAARRADRKARSRATTRKRKCCCRSSTPTRTPGALNRSIPNSGLRWSS